MICGLTLQSWNCDPLPLGLHSPPGRRLNPAIGLSPGPQTGLVDILPYPPDLFCGKPQIKYCFQSSRGGLPTYSPCGAARTATFPFRPVYVKGLPGNPRKPWFSGTLSRPSHSFFLHQRPGCEIHNRDDIPWIFQKQNPHL